MRKRIPQNQLRKRTLQFNHTSELDTEPESLEPELSEPDALEPDAEDMFQLSTTTTVEATADQPKLSTTQP